MWVYSSISCGKVEYMHIANSAGSMFEIDFQTGQTFFRFELNLEILNKFKRIFKKQKFWAYKSFLKLWQIHSKVSASDKEQPVKQFRTLFGFKTKISWRGFKACYHYHIFAFQAHNVITYSAKQPLCTLITPRKARISGLKILTLETTIFGFKMMVKSGQIFLF